MKRATIVVLTSTSVLALALALVALDTDRADAQSAPSGPRPFQFQRNLSFDGDSVSEPMFTVPAGTLLVIEHVSASVSVPHGQKLLTFNVVTSVRSGQPFVQHFLPQTPLQGTSPFADFYTVSQPVRVYAGPSTPVFLSSIRNGSDAGTVNILLSFSGHLVACAPGPDCRVP